MLSHDSALIFYSECWPCPVKSQEVGDVVVSGNLAHIQGVKPTLQLRTAAQDPPPSVVAASSLIWAGLCADLASECGLSQDLAAAFSRVAEFFSGLPR